MTVRAMPRFAASFVLLVLAEHAFAQDAPPIVIRSTQHNGPQVWAQDRVGAPATNSTATIQAPSGGAGAAAAVNATGSNVATNKALVAQPSAMVVEGQLKCQAAPKTWSASATCSANLPVTPAGSSAVASDTEVAVNTGRGSATYTCQADGTWASAPTSSTCSAQCPATTLSWTVGAATCSAAIGTGASPAAATIVDSASPGTGQATFTCQGSGAWSAPAGASCINNPPPGAFSSDYFYWASWGTNGENDEVAMNGLTIAAIDTNPAVDFSHGLWSRWSSSVTPRPDVITKYGSGWAVISWPAPTIVTNTGIHFYPQNCVPGSKDIRYQAYQAWRVTISGWFCRSGYTP